MNTPTATTQSAIHAARDAAMNAWLVVGDADRAARQSLVEDGYTGSRLDDAAFDVIAWLCDEVHAPE